MSFNSGSSYNKELEQLSEYVERKGPYADAKHRREVAFHICDCAVCSKRLKELHKRRSVELESRPSPQPEQASPGKQIRRSGERRTGIDRRQSDPAVPGTAERRKRRATAAASRGAGAGKRGFQSYHIQSVSRWLLHSAYTVSQISNVRPGRAGLF